MVKTLRTEHLWTFTVPWHVGDAGQEGIWGLVGKRSKCLTGENFDQIKVSHSSYSDYSAVVPKVRKSEIWNPGIFFSWNRESVLWNSEYRSKIPDPTIDWNPESKFHWQRIRLIHYLGSEIRDLDPRIQDCLEFPYMGRTVTDYGCGRLKCANNNIMLLAGTSYTGERIWTGRYFVRVTNQIINHQITFEKVGKHYYF